jgi:glycosyltransferase involved in cell wall biosynthesis
VVVVTPAFKTHLIQKWGVPGDKIVVIENGVETDLFRPFTANKINADLRNASRVEGKFVVCYIGTLGLAHGLETLVDAASRLLSSHPEVLFLLVGEGADKERIFTLARERNLPNLHFIDQQPRETIPAYIAASDVCLVLLKKTDVFKTVIPTKMLEFMSCGRPVILGVDGQAREVLEEAQAGIFIEPENAEQLQDAILRLAADVQLRTLLGENGRKYVVQKASRGATAKAYIAVLENLLDGTQDY